MTSVLKLTIPRHAPRAFATDAYSGITQLVPSFSATSGMNTAAGPPRPTTVSFVVKE